MKLSNILKGITDLNFAECEISNITLDSRKAEPGCLFCAIKGHKIDARKFIKQAIENGVTAILADADDKEFINNKNDVQIIYLENLNSKLSQIAENFYNSPSKKLELVGITGTNGKTTISQLIAQWSHILGKKSATMGTIGNGIYGNLETAENTTGSALDIQQNLAEFAQQKAQTVSMEVSSHGLVQNRIKALNFKVGVFTNLTQDHLDYHKTMEEYFAAKALLFTSFGNKFNVINIDDSWGQKLCDLIADKNSIIAVSCKQQNLEQNFKNYLYLKNVKHTNSGFEFSVKSNFGDCQNLKTKLIGQFNLSNILQAMATMFALNFKQDELVNSIEKLQPVIGRMEVFKKANSPTLIVDYAHTPDALEKALQAVAEHKPRQLWCIFGCGGDRDITKRPLMAQMAEKYADKVIVTNDNPRTENQDNIIKDVLIGIKNDAEVIKNRFSAIEFATNNANSNDIILIAGKGHEDYQIFGTEKVHYSDRESAQEILKIKE